MTASAYPLAWPPHNARTPAGQRKRAKFSKKVEERVSYSSSTWMRSQDLTVADGRTRLLDELRRLKDQHGRLARGIVISTNLELRNDGLPRSDRREPEDPGRRKKSPFSTSIGNCSTMPC